MPTKGTSFKMARFIVCLLFLAPVAAKISAQDAGQASIAKGRTLPMVDDHDVLYRSGTTRVLTPWKRASREALVSQTKPWEVAIGWTSIYRDGASGKYQLWYQAYAGKRAGDKRLECVVCYAESD